MYGFWQPPLFLFAFGLFVSIACGLAFEGTLKQGLSKWNQDHSRESLAQIQGPTLQLPYLGICAGVCLFLASGLGIFMIPPTFAYGVSVLLTIAIAGLVWSQLGKLLIQLERGGSKSLDLDAIN